MTATEKTYVYGSGLNPGDLIWLTDKDGKRIAGQPFIVSCVYVCEDVKGFYRVRFEECEATFHIGANELFERA